MHTCIQTHRHTGIHAHVLCTIKIYTYMCIYTHRYRCRHSYIQVHAYTRVWGREREFAAYTLDPEALTASLQFSITRNTAPNHEIFEHYSTLNPIDHSSTHHWLPRCNLQWHRLPGIKGSGLGAGSGGGGIGFLCLRFVQGLWLRFL